MSTSHDTHRQTDHGGHGGHDAHAAHGTPVAPGSPAGIAAHTSMEIPPAPTVREITPARGDYAQPWPGRLLFWPLVWLIVGALFFVVARKATGPIVQHEEAAGEGEHSAPAEHGAPGHPEPSPGSHEKPVDGR